MSLLNRTRRIADCVKSFGVDRKGGVALMAGLAFPMLFIGVGGALDYSNAIPTKHNAQRAMDATVLALTRLDLEPTDVQAEGKKMFASLLTERGITAQPTEVQFTLTETLVTGSGLVEVETFFLGYVGTDWMTAKVESAAVPPADRPIEIALVLDASGSMLTDLNGLPRITRLKNAVDGMLNTLDEELPSDADLSIAVVPYSTSVNVGNFPQVFGSSSVSGQPKPAFGSSIWAAERSVIASGTDFTLSDASPVGNAVPFVTAGEMGGATPVARLSALTDDMDAVRASVTSITPSGWTAGHIGMTWGVYSLSPKWASVWPQDPEPIGDADKVIVMLSDGEFNTTHNIGNADNGDGVHSDAYFQAACDMARSQRITIFAVALALDPVSEAKLQACVGASGKLYKADSASDLSNAFKDIARRFGTHRLTS